MRRPDTRSLAEGYEHSDAPARLVIAGGVGLIVVLVIVVIGITSFESAQTSTPATVALPADLIQGLQSNAAPTPPVPRLEAQSGDSYAAYRAAEDQKLNGYRWVDRNAGTVSIPIERAIDLIAQQGLPARAATDTAQTAPSGSSSGRVDQAYP